MLSRTKKQKKQKRGVSIVIGYVLLIGLAVVMGGFLYIWMKSYVPTEALECPEGTSLIIKEYNYNCSDARINITLKNNGRFNVSGYFIYVSNNPNITLPAINIYDKLVEKTYGPKKYAGKNSVLFDLPSNVNTFAPNQEIEHEFNNLYSIGRIYYIQIVPVRWQEHENVLRFTSCGEASAFKEKIVCNI